MRETASRASGKKRKKLGCKSKSADSLATLIKTLEVRQQAVNAYEKAKAPKEGYLHRLVDAWDEELRKEGINVQKWFGGTMNGPDVRRFFKARTNLLQNIQRAIQDSGRTGNENFAQRHLGVLDALATVSHLSRTVRDLTPMEEEEIKAACKAYGEACHAAYPDYIPTPKDHNIVRHFPDLVERHGTLGRLSEESMESWHAIDAKFRRIIRCVVNPEDFQETLMRYHARFQHNTEKQKAKRQRRTPAQMQAAAAATAAATAAPAAAAAQPQWTHKREHS